MKTLEHNRSVGEKVSYFGSRNVVLNGVIIDIDSNMYVVRDDISKLVYRILPGDLLQSKS